MMVLGGMLTLPSMAGENAAAPQATNAPTVSPSGAQRKRLHQNLCPVCGRERSVCHSESMKAMKNPGGKEKLCPIYKQDFVSGESRPVPCPVCRNIVRLPQRNQKIENTDSDLCPHPEGNVRFMSELAVCPRCGFAAYRADFFAPVKPEISDWVKTNLQPHMPATLRHILGKEAKIDDAKLVELFSAQREIPDILRCKNAFTIMTERARRGDPGVTTAGLAKMAWMTAWAHRRAISEAFGDGVLLEGARRVISAIQRSELAENTLEEGIRMLTGIFGDKERFDVLERQLMRIIQAGYYNRLGLNFWANGVLNQVMQEVTVKKYDNPGTDPWMQIKVAKGLKAEEKEKVIKLAKDALANAADTRLACLKGELEYLGTATDLIVQGLAKNQLNANEIPTYFYLVGEFERRRENHSRALFWLQAAAQICDKDGEIKLEHCAPEQVDILKRYVFDRKLTPPSNPQAESDMKIATAAAETAKKAQAAARAAKAKAADTAPQTAAPAPAKP